MNLQPASPTQCRRLCDPQQFSFATTAELETTDTIIGQPRGTRAIEFGINIKSQGFNIYVLGEVGTGRTTAIMQFLREKSKEKPVPNDWIYVNNFAVPYQPRAISFSPGDGKKFQNEIATLISHLEEDLSKAFASEAYLETVKQWQGNFEQMRTQRLQSLRQKAAQEGLAIVTTPSGFGIGVVQNGQMLDPAAFQQLPLAEQEQLQIRYDVLAQELQELLGQFFQQEDELRERLGKLQKEVAAAALEYHFNRLRTIYASHVEVLLYLDELHTDILNSVNLFQASNDEDNPTLAEIDSRRYEVNLFVDNGHLSGVPVIIETNPTFTNLMGRIEYETMGGGVTTHFTNIKPGSIHRANGGYLVINALDLLRQPFSWEALKRAIKEQQITLQSPEMLLGGQIPAKSLDPEPIPLSVKIILMGSTALYETLVEREEDFMELFKVKADFDTVMPRDLSHELMVAGFIANCCQEEGLRHFDRYAAAKIVEFSSRLCEHQNRLSTRFGAIADLVREASYWAGVRGRDSVTPEDVQTALDERTYRTNRLEERLLEQVTTHQIYITTTGSIIGQVNALSVVASGDYSFGIVSRITARTYLGEDGVIAIDREVEMAGPIHNKGILILTGYLGGQYAQNHPLSLNASLTFEQNYGPVDGDSASSTELYALLSSIGQIPLQQNLAVTGSVNQRGEIQPIGGVTEKVEGFFQLCQERGLDGTQGVIIPQANLVNLNLNDKVLAAVAAGQFHIWPIQTIDEGMTLLTGLPAGEPQADGTFPTGTVHSIVQKQLHRLAHTLKDFSDK